jgi:hypothetical protein
MSVFRRRAAKTAGRGAAQPKTAAKQRSDPPALAAATPVAALADAARPVPFDLAGFPLLPLGSALFSDVAGNIEGLDQALPHLPSCLIVLTAPDARGAVLVADGAAVDAVWVDEAHCLVGAEAARAVFGARVGTVAAHYVDDPRLVAAAPLLWQAPRLCGAVPGQSINVESFVAGVRTAGCSCALLVSDSADPGVALFGDGALVAVYSAAKPAPVSTTAALGRLLRASGARVTLLGAEVTTDQDPEIGGTTFPLIAHASYNGAAAVADVDAGGPAAAVSQPPAGEAPAATPSADDSNEFVPPRVDVDIDALRTELTGIAGAWLGKDDAAPVAAAILAARPGVHDFVAAIQAIASLDIPGHDDAAIRAMAREMHYRAAEVLCGV